MTHPTAYFLSRDVTFIDLMFLLPISNLKQCYLLDVVVLFLRVTDIHLFEHSIIKE